MRRHAAALALAALLAGPSLAGCAAPPKPRPGGENVVFQGGAAAGPFGAVEAGRLSRESPSIAGPFVLTSLEAGAVLEIRPADGKGAPVGALVGPLTTPFQVPAGVKLTVTGEPGGALYSGYRPMPLTRALEAWMGRTVQVVQGGQAEPWTLRQIGADHVIVERSRTYRIIPLRRIAEIGWSDLSGIDPTPKVILSAD